MVSDELVNESDESQVGTSCQVGIYIIACSKVITQRSINHQNRINNFKALL